MASLSTEESVGPICILNGASSRVEAAREHLVRVSAEFGVEPRIVVAQGADLPLSAARALGANSRMVVAGGGDGTINAVAGALVGRDTALGVLPIGTLNHFARDVGIPLNLESAVRNLFTGQVKKVDVGEVNGRVFVNNSGIGLYPRIVRVREEAQETHAAARRTPFVFVGNNKYEIAGLEIGTRSSLNSGRLWACVAPRTGRRNLVRMALRALLGRVTDHELDAFEAEEFSVETATRSVNVSTDGEVTVMDAPLHYRIRPGALHVVAPALHCS
jgi:diacylglycerol kinase family enzyme